MDSSDLEGANDDGDLESMASGHHTHNSHRKADRVWEVVVILGKDEL